MWFRKITHAMKIVDPCVKPWSQRPKTHMKAASTLHVELVWQKLHHRIRWSVRGHVDQCGLGKEHMQ